MIDSDNAPELHLKIKQQTDEGVLFEVDGTLSDQSIDWYVSRDDVLILMAEGSDREFFYIPSPDDDHIVAGIGALGFYSYSNPVALRKTEPPILEMSSNKNRFFLMFNVDDGAAWTLQYVDSIDDEEWQTLDTEAQRMDQKWGFQIEPTESKQFFRLKYQGDL